MLISVVAIANADGSFKAIIRFKREIYRSHIIDGEIRLMKIPVIDSIITHSEDKYMEILNDLTRNDLPNHEQRFKSLV